MSEDETLKRMEQRIAEQMNDAIFRGHWHETSTAAAPETKPTSLTLDAFMAAYDKAVQAIDSAPVSVPVLVDLPDFLRVRVYYRMTEHLRKLGDDGAPVFFKVKPGILYGCDHETFLMHPDNADDFVKAVEAAGAFAVDLAAMQRGEVDEYGRPIVRQNE
jgi:hypothetical protein